MASKLDQRQIVQREHDENHNAKRVKMVETELSMELNAADGDSVLVFKHQVETQELDSPINCSGLSVATLYVKSGSAHIEVSPKESGDEFYPINNVASMAQHEINAKRVKIIADSPGTEAHLIVRS